MCHMEIVLKWNNCGACQLVVHDSLTLAFETDGFTSKHGFLGRLEQLQLVYMRRIIPNFRLVNITIQLDERYLLVYDDHKPWVHKHEKETKTTLKGKTYLRTSLREIRSQKELNHDNYCRPMLYWLQVSSFLGTPHIYIYICVGYPKLGLLHHDFDVLRNNGMEKRDFLGIPGIGCGWILQDELFNPHRKIPISPVKWLLFPMSGFTVLNSHD